MKNGYGIGEFEDDGALDERDELIDWLVRRIEHATSSESFCGVDISGARANLVMLATIIEKHGGGHLVKRAKVEEWSRKIDGPFITESSWGFRTWPVEVKAEWRTGCKQTAQKLLAVLED